MNLVSLILPNGQQYKFTTKKNATACLSELRTNLKQSKSTPEASLSSPSESTSSQSSGSGPTSAHSSSPPSHSIPYALEGRIVGDNFVIQRYFKSKLRKLFSPQLQGTVSLNQSNTIIQVVTAPNPSAASLINSSLSTYLDAEALEKRALDIDTKNGAGAERGVGEDLNDMALQTTQRKPTKSGSSYYDSKHHSNRSPKYPPRVK